MSATEPRPGELAHEPADEVVTWIMALDGRITFVSPSVERMRGITPEVAMHQTLEQIHPPSSMAVSEAYYVRLVQVLQAGRAPDGFRGELEYYCADGSTIWTEVQVIPHLDEDGRVMEIMGTTRKIDRPGSPA